MDNDLIEKLLLNTGLSCDELLSKLQVYKSVKCESSNSTTTTINTNEVNSDHDKTAQKNNSDSTEEQVENNTNVENRLLIKDSGSKEEGTISTTEEQVENNTIVENKPEIESPSTPEILPLNDKTENSVEVDEQQDNEEVKKKKREFFVENENSLKNNGLDTDEDETEDDFKVSIDRIIVSLDEGDQQTESSSTKLAIEKDEPLSQTEVSQENTIFQRDECEEITETKQIIQEDSLDKSKVVEETTVESIIEHPTLQSCDSNLENSDNLELTSINQARVEDLEINTQDLELDLNVSSNEVTDLEVNNIQSSNFVNKDKEIMEKSDLGLENVAEENVINPCSSNNAESLAADNKSIVEFCNEEVIERKPDEVLAVPEENSKLLIPENQICSEVTAKDSNLEVSSTNAVELNNDETISENKVETDDKENLPMDKISFLPKNEEVPKISEEEKPKPVQEKRSGKRSNDSHVFIKPGPVKSNTSTEVSKESSSLPLVQRTYKKRSRISDTLFKKLVLNEIEPTTSPETVETPTTSLVKSVTEKTVLNIANKEHDYSATFERATRSTEVVNDLFMPEAPISKTEDDLRNTLRMQLSSLRNMKKTSSYLPDLKKTSLFFHNLKKKRKSIDKSECAAINSVEEKKEEPSPVDSGLVSLSKETDFVIVNVVGGVDVITSENTTKSDKNLTVKKHLGDNFNEDPGVQTTSKTSTKSPFVSDSLDDFLNESSQLQISYPIPKLGAEEGISDVDKVRPFQNFPQKVTKNEKVHPKEIKEKTKLAKPKTLAEMRRQFEKMKAKDLKQFIPQKKQKSKPALEPEKNINRNSYIMVNNKKIRVYSTIPAKCLTVVKSVTENNNVKSTPEEALKLTTPTNRKPSLLSSLAKPPGRLKYKAGPLSKKTLSTTFSNEWTTELRTLPEIHLEVTPEIHKPLAPEISHLIPIFDDVIITETRTNFALSVLKSKNELQTFDFKIPYKNHQNQILVRKPIPPKCETKFKSDVDITPDVEKVINGLLNYVETKEIEDSLLKNDDVEFETVVASPTKKKMKCKRNKLRLELKRLNCKVIDVATAEDETNCSKTYCRLGCVCKTLLCEGVFSNHCQLVDCMFGCTCAESRGTLKTKTLSATTVTQLEDIAKKNLAKVEKEFTQTFINTDDDAILINTTKERRSSKKPKKYNDYIEDDIFDNSTPVIPNQSSAVCKDFSIMVENLELKDVIPFCMEHKKYNCVCKGSAVTLPKKVVPRLKLVKTKHNYYEFQQDDTISPPPVVEAKKEWNYKRKQKLEPLSENIPLPKQKKLPPKAPVKKYMKKNLEGVCARTREVFAEYRSRNKEPLYIEKIWKKYGLDNPKQAIVYEPFYSSDIIVSGDNDTTIAHTLSTERNNKRKQSFIVKEDFPFSMQRRKKRAYQPFTPVFDGEIRLTLKDHQDMLGFVGNQDTELGYLRVLPWTNLVQSFQMRNVNIWTKENAPKSQLLCSCKGLLAPKGYIDIRRAINRSNIINWIITDSLPPDKPRDLMHLILTPKGIHFAIAGYCVKKISSEVQTTNIQDPPTIEGEETTVEISEDISVDASPFKIVELTSILKPIVTVTRVNEMPELDKEIDGSTQMEVDDHETNSLDNEMPNLNLEVTETNNENTRGMEEDADLLTNEQVRENSDSLSNEQVKENDAPLSNEVINGEPLNATPLDETDVIEINDNTPIITKTRTKIKHGVKSQTNKIPRRNLKCSHKDMFNKNKALILTNTAYVKRKIFSEHVPNKELKVPLPPTSKNHKWRMIYLKSDFAYLNFIRSSYSIKYNDLMDVVKMAGKVRSTIVLRNKDFTQHYKHPLFGIYCVPEFQDRLFFGPYLMNENHHIETLRYLQKKLIDSYIFNQMVGRKVVDQEPIWLFESSKRNINAGKDVVIDITEDDDVVKIDSDSEEDAELIANSLLCEPFVEKMTPEEIKEITVFNRYIITNIPHLGYFKARQKSGKSIEIIWPNGNKGYKFPTVTFAKHLLTQYFTQVFCPIPSHFKINVIILTNVDLQANKLISTKFLSSKYQYFCGEFGISAKEDISSAILAKYDISSVDTYLQKHRESYEHEDAMIRLFGLFCMTNEELRKNQEPSQILKWAKSEIYIMRKLEGNYEAQKKDLKAIIEKKKSTVNKANDQISETIEIPDSDEEDSSSFQKVETSGKIQIGTTDSTPPEPVIIVSNVMVKSGYSLLRNVDVNSC